MSLIREVSDEQLEELLVESKVPLVLMCTSPECIICKTMRERIKEVAPNFEGKVNFLSLDINKNKLWQKFNVMVIPTLLYFKGGVCVGCQDKFPDPEEIAEQIKKTIKVKESFLEAIKRSIEAEYIIARFYSYIASETKNGKVRKVFSRFSSESDDHRSLLENKFEEITGYPFYLDVNRLELEGLIPQNFSLIGAVEAAIDTEEEAVKFYKLASKKASAQTRQMFKKLVKEESRHFKALKKELGFLKDKDTLSPLEKSNYQKFMGKIWE